MQGFFQRIKDTAGAYFGWYYHGDGDAVDIVGLAEIKQLGLGSHRVGNHRQAAIARQQSRRSPVDVDHLAFSAIDADRIADLIGASGIEHDPREHVTEGALQRQADDDGHHPGSGQQAFDR
ncbi:hypothetical protein D3C79_874130 [compost metagenome]